MKCKQIKYPIKKERKGKEFKYVVLNKEMATEKEKIFMRNYKGFRIITTKIFIINLFIDWHCCAYNL